MEQILVKVGLILATKNKMVHEQGKKKFIYTN